MKSDWGYGAETSWTIGCSFKEFQLGNSKASWCCKGTSWTFYRKGECSERVSRCQGCWDKMFDVISKEAGGKLQVVIWKSRCYCWCHNLFGWIEHWIYKAASS